MLGYVVAVCQMTSEGIEDRHDRARLHMAQELFLPTVSFPAKAGQFMCASPIDCANAISAVTPLVE